MSNEDNQLKPLEFQARLKYKVGNTYKYLTIDEFTFDKIRNMNMYDREKEKFIQGKQRIEELYIWKDDPENFKEFKAHLDGLDENKTRFKIPYCSYYFTYDNLNAVIKEKQSDSNFSQYNNNYSNFFILNKDNSDQHIRDYFQELKKNLDENIREANKTSVTNSMNQQQTNDWNNDNMRNFIVNEYGKYILSNAEIAETDANKLYDRLKSNDTKMKNIITYHNIFKILDRFYLNPGCILHERIYEDIKGDILKTKEPIYIKIKNITPVKLTDQEIQTSFDYNILRPVYEIEFEKVPHFSKIQFNITFMDLDNPDTSNKITPEITNIGRYQLHENKIFYNTESEKRTDKDIYIKRDLDYNKLLTQYTTGKIVNIKDIFMNFDKFNKISSRYKSINTSDINSIIKDYYVEQFFFENGGILNHNNKFAKIEKATIKKLNGKTEFEPLRYYNLKSSPYIRLAVDDLQSIYDIYIDLEVTYTDKVGDKKPLKTRYKRAFGCIQKANTIDGILHSLLGDNYTKNILEEKMRNRTSTAITDKQESSKQNSYHSGGLKAKRKKTRARRNKNKHSTLKMIKYYAQL